MQSPQQVIKLPELGPGQGVNFTMPQLSVTYLGYGQFTPEIEYHPIPANMATAVTPVTSQRNSVFAFVPSLNQIFFFQNKLGGENLQEYKAAKAIEKVLKFNLFRSDVYAYFLYLDTPDKSPGQSVLQPGGYYHQDLPATTIAHDVVKQALQHVGITHTKNPEINRFSSIFSDYTLIEYRLDSCISTTVKNPFVLNDIIRFHACNGSVMCVQNNVTQEHSTPYVHETIPGGRGEMFIPDRTAGNIFLQGPSVSRPLYRTQLQYVTKEKFDQLINVLNLSQLHLGQGVMLYNEIGFSEFGPMLAQLEIDGPFPTMDLQQYTFNSPKKLERGGSIKSTLSTLRKSGAKRRSIKSTLRKSTFRKSGVKRRRRRKSTCRKI
jgi:hypothetical protein